MIRIQNKIAAFNMFNLDLPQVDLMNFRVEYVRLQSGVEVVLRPADTDE